MTEHDTSWWKFCWLIEAPGANYLGVRRLGCDEFYWTIDHNKALRFMSKEQADGVMMAIRETVPALFSFAGNLGDAWPREHGWLNDEHSVPSDFTRSDQQTVVDSRAEQNTLREEIEELFEELKIGDLPDEDLCSEHYLLRQAASLLRRLGEPIKMVLFCPSCGLQHIDEPDERTPDWTNPPHRSHLCHGCGHIWRPADVATEGVRHLETVGKADSPQVLGRVATISRLQAELEEGRALLRPFADCVELIDGGLSLAVCRDDGSIIATDEAFYNASSFLQERKGE